MRDRERGLSMNRVAADASPLTFHWGDLSRLTSAGEAPARITNFEQSAGEQRQCHTRRSTVASRLPGGRPVRHQSFLREISVAVEPDYSGRSADRLEQEDQSLRRRFPPEPTSRFDDTIGMPLDAPGSPG